MTGNNIGPVRLKEAWVLFFLLGIVMINYPFLHIFNKNISFFGIPALILYLFIGWPISILVIYLFSRVIVVQNGQNNMPAENEKEQP